MAGRVSNRSIVAPAAGVFAVALALGGAGCAADPALRGFPDRPVAWHEHDAENVPRAPRPSDLGELDSALITRDDLAGEVDGRSRSRGRGPRAT